MASSCVPGSGGRRDKKAVNFLFNQIHTTKADIRVA